MEFEKLLKLNIEQKKKILSNLIENDVSYWEKVSILMAMLDEEAATDLLDLIVKHKREEINLANKKYNLFLNSDESIFFVQVLGGSVYAAGYSEMVQCQKGVWFYFRCRGK